MVISECMETVKNRVYRFNSNVPAICLLFPNAPVRVAVHLKKFGLGL